MTTIAAVKGVSHKAHLPLKISAIETLLEVCLSVERTVQTRSSVPVL